MCEDIPSDIPFYSVLFQKDDASVARMDDFAPISGHGLDWLSKDKNGEIFS